MAPRTALAVAARPRSEEIEARCESPAWRLASAPDPARVRSLQESLGIHPLAAGVLAARGFDDPERARGFLEPSLADLHDPFLLAGMEEAVKRLRAAIEREETIVVYGDYDVDGVTSVAVLIAFLRACGARVEAYIPKRLVEGYGLNMAAVEELGEQGTRLLVTCDCGVTAAEEIDRAVSLGIDVIVVDHHKLGERMPRAVVIDPLRPDCSYPFSQLAAVGLTFKLVMALRKRLRETGFFDLRKKPEPNLRSLLDLVALGTVSDVVPLVDENRILTFHGLQVLAEGRRVGLVALMAVAGVDRGSVSSGQVAYRLGPRLNAAGRLDDARAGLDLVLCEDAYEASRLAGALEIANSTRQAIEKEMTEEALDQARQVDPAERGLVLSSPGWHPGVVGIVASRVVEQFMRPTLVLGCEEGVLKGSGRSVGSFHLFDALSACAEHLVRFGGHAAAAGLQLPVDSLPAFRRAFSDYCGAMVSEADLQQVLRVDAMLDPSRVDEKLIEALEMLAPFGAGNPAPVFAAKGVALRERRLVGKPGVGGKTHLKCRVGGVEAIGFGLGNAASREGDALDIAYNVGINSWRGEHRPQLSLKAVETPGRIRID